MAGKKDNRLLVVYYSNTGNNRMAAQKLGKMLGCDMDEIIDNTDRSGGWGIFKSAMGAVFKTKADIQKPKKDPEGYDIVILCTPAWAGNLPSPTRAYLYMNKGKIRKIAVLSVSGMGSNPSAMAEIEKIAGSNAISMLQIKVPNKEGKKKGEMDKLDELDLELPEIKAKLDDFVKAIKSSTIPG